jgi:hypothetical protein
MVEGADLADVEVKAQQLSHEIKIIERDLTCGCTTA